MPRVTPSRRTVRALGVLALASLFGFAVAATAPDGPGQAQTSRPGDRAMFVSVLNKDGAPVTDLTPADFKVGEDGVAREVLWVEKATEPITLALLVDTSQSATPYIADMRRSLKTFVKRLGDRKSVV